MPKKEGAKSTRKTIPLAEATIANFVMPWDKFVGEKPCCIEGCGHKAHGNQGTLAHPDFCGTSNAAAIYDERLMPGPKPDPHVGLACPHCTDLLLDQGA